MPGLVVGNDGRARSWWWPLPAASDRLAVSRLVTDPSPEAQHLAAELLAAEVDRLVRLRLVGSETGSDRPLRRGRPSVAGAWTRSLVSADPWLAPSIDPAKLAVFAAAIDEWVRSGAVIGGRARLCLRLHEPPETPSSPAAPSAGESEQSSQPWRVELLAQDSDEPSVMVGLEELWTGGSSLPFSSGLPEVLEEVLTALGRMARLAPELVGVLDSAVPSHLEMGDAEVLTLLRSHVGPLDEAGIGVLLPSWWSRPARVGLRARALGADGSGGSVAPGGLGLKSVVNFEWQAALGDELLSRADLAALRRAADAKQSLVRLRGQWVEINAASIAGLVERVGRRDKTTAERMLRAGLGLDDLSAPDGVEVVGVDAGTNQWLGSFLNNAVHTTITPIDTPASFVGMLRPYQQRGLAWLSFLGELGLGACLADDMGLGKTAQLIACLLHDQSVGPTLVICPVSVLGNWERELARFAPGLSVLVHHGAARHADDRPLDERAADHDVVLSTYSLLSRDLHHLSSTHWERVVFDEAQQIKNPSSAQTRAAAALDAGRRVALTGTPVENRLSDLWSIMNVLNPGLLGSASAFRQHFARPIEQDKDAEATELLRRVTGPFILRRLKSDRSIIDDLPGKIETVDTCPLTREQATLYRAVVDDLLAQVEESEGIARKGIVLAGLLRLKQVCNHPAQFANDGSPLAGRSGKLIRAEELLEEIVAAGDKVLCFTQFAAWGTLLLPYLQRRLGVEAMWLHGGVRRTLRDEMVVRFGEPEGPPLFLVSLKAGGSGLNLTAASHVIHLDRWWNPAVEDQATDRAYRIGQRRTVQVHKLVSSGTIEERVDEMITAKRNLAESVVGDGENWLTELSTSELAELIALAPGSTKDGS